MTCNGDCNQGRECNCECKMTDREEFEKQMVEQAPTFSYEIMLSINNSGDYTSLITDHCWTAWQARGELDAVRIKELEDRLQEVATDWQVKEQECVTLRSDKAILEIQVQALREVLDRLSKLGNEPLLGNSDGNKIARTALEELDK